MYTNLNPNPQTGVMNPYGAVPGSISAVPTTTISNLPNPGADLSGVVPNLGSMNTAATGDILGQLSGNLSPATLASLRNAAAQWGVGSGTGMGTMGLGDLANNNLFGNVAGYAENQVNKGIQNYNQTIPTISSTQTLSPGLQLQAATANMGAMNQADQFNAGVASHNALNAAAPNPATAQSYAQQLFQQYMDAMRSPAGGSQPSPSAGQGSVKGVTQPGTETLTSEDNTDWMGAFDQLYGNQMLDPNMSFDETGNPAQAPYNFGGDFGGLSDGFGF